MASGIRGSGPDGRRRRVDPDGGRHYGRLRRLAHEALGMGGIGRGEDLTARGADELDLPIVHHRRGELADPAVTMLV